MELQDNQDDRREQVQTNQPATNAYDENQVDETALLRQNHSLMSKKTKKAFIIICSVAILAGIMTGFGAFKLKNKEVAVTEVQNVTTDTNKIKNGDIFGVKNEDTFPDNATGYVEKGGVEGEGSHKLLREGGASQTVALTSSVVDLDKLAGMEVKLHGETHKAEKAGWFMDVGRVEVVNTEAQAPIQTLE